MDANLIKRKLLVKYPFFGSVIANTKFVEEPNVTTAGTDGETIYYNVNFLNSITVEQQVFIFAHEICHIAFNHILRSKDKEHELWNIATDSVVNALLKNDGLPIIEGAVDIPEAINYDAETMYNKLLEEKKTKNQENSNGSNGEENNSDSSNNKDSNQSNGGASSENDESNNHSNDASGNSTDSSSNNEEKSNEPNESNGGSSNENDESNNHSNDEPGNSTDSSSNNEEKSNEPNESNGGSSSNESNEEEKTNSVGHDTHSMWAKAVEKKEQQEKEKTQNNNDYNNHDKNEDIKEQEINEKDAFKQNKIERDKQLEELRKALVSKSHGFGNDTNSDQITINDIGTSKPIIDWRMALRESINYDVDWSYKNAEIEDGVVTPYLEEQPRPETEILLDTSGSISKTLLKNFLRECKNIIQNSNVKVGCFDTKFYGFTEIKDVHDIDNLNIIGGGGTNFDVAVNAFSRRVENKIIFTDGDAKMPDKPIDAIWIVFGYLSINPKGGKVIYIDDEQLKKLYNSEFTQKRGKTL